MWGGKEGRGKGVARPPAVDGVDLVERCHAERRSLALTIAVALHAIGERCSGTPSPTCPPFGGRANVAEVHTLLIAVSAVAILVGRDAALGRVRRLPAHAGGAKGGGGHLPLACSLACRGLLVAHASDDHRSIVDLARRASKYMDWRPTRRSCACVIMQNQLRPEHNQLRPEPTGSGLGLVPMRHGGLTGCNG